MAIRERQHPEEERAFAVQVIGQIGGKSRVGRRLLSDGVGDRVIVEHLRRGTEIRRGRVAQVNDVAVGENRPRRIVGALAVRRYGAGGPRAGAAGVGRRVQNRIAVRPDQKHAAVRQEEARPEFLAQGRTRERYRDAPGVLPGAARRVVALRRTRARRRAVEDVVRENAAVIRQQNPCLLVTAVAVNFGPGGGPGIG